MIRIITAVVTLLVAINVVRADVALIDSTDQGQRRITMENGFLRLVIDPHDGGRIVSLVHKRTGRELTPLRTDTQPGGLLSDGIWSQDYFRGDWNRSKYSVEILDKGPATAKVALTGSGRMWNDVFIRKEISLDANRSAVSVLYTMSCGPKVNAKLLPDFWFHNAIQGSGKAYFPTPQGVLAFPLGAEEDSWEFEPTAGWCAFVREDGLSMSATMEFNHLRAVRSCHRGSGGTNTLEWFWRYLKVSPDMKVQSPAQLGVFTGLKEVTGASGAAAAELVIGAEKDGKRPVTVTVAALEEIAGEVTLAIRRLPDGTEKPVGTSAIKIAPDATASATFDVVAGGEGSYVIVAFLRNDKGELLRCEKPLIIGQPSGTYAAMPASETRPEAGRRYAIPIDYNFNSLSVETPHVKWARPYAGGRPRVLAFLPVGHGREAVELAQRFDMDLTTTYLNGELVGWSLGDSSMSTKELQAHQAEILKKDYDLIILCNSWELLSGDARKSVQEKVEKGTGLLVAGGIPKDLKDFLPMKALADSMSSRWMAAKESPLAIARGLPFDALPPMRMTGMALAAVADELLDEPPTVLVGGKGTFYAAEWKRGKGRVVQVNSGTLLSTPTTSGGGWAAGDPPMFPWWEYNYALLGRLIYRAAGKATPVDVMDIKCAGTSVTATLQSRMEGAAEAHFTLRDPFGQIVHDASVQVPLKKGSQEVKLEAPAAVAGQYRFADVVLTGAKGTLAWGAGSVPTGPVRLGKCDFDKPYYAPNDTATVKMTSSGATGGKAVMRAELWDASNRKLAAAEAPATGEATLSLPLGRVIGPAFDVRTFVVVDGATQDAGMIHGYIKRPWQHRLLRTFFWGGPGLGDYPGHLVYDIYKRLHDVGMNSNWGDKYPESHSWTCDRLNMAFELASTGMSFQGMTKQEMIGQSAPAASASAKAAQDLDETVSERGVGSAPPPVTVDKNAQKGGIGDPWHAADLRERGAAKAKLWQHRNLLAYGCADENRGPGRDVNFNPPALAEFRRWLRETQFKSLEDLNREWATSFKSWDEVMPLSEDEAREHGRKTGCYGAWADQRMFNKWSYATFAKSFTDGVRSVDPDAIVGDSGTQESAIYSGRDWSLLAPAYTGISAYGGTQTSEQDMFNPTLVRLPWNGYNKHNPRNRNSCWAIISANNYGYGYFCDNSYIDPDYTLCHDGRDLQAAQVDINNGAGQLIVDAKVVWDPVYVYHSMASLHGAYMAADTLSLQLDVHRQSKAGVLSVLKDLGIAFRAVTGEQVKKGYLGESGARILFLPNMVALSEAEVQGIRQWVEGGGTVVADMAPAFMDEHCRMLGKGQLDDLFGIDRSNVTIAAGKDAEGGKSKPWLTCPKGLIATGPFCEASLVETGLKVTGEAIWIAKREPNEEPIPIVFRRTVGKGTAWYLGYHAAGSYDSMKSAVLKDPAAAAALIQIQGLFENLLAGAGVKPHSTICLRDPQKGETGSRSPYTWTFNKASGDLRYVTALRDFYAAGAAIKDFPARVVFDKPGYIYEMRTGSYLGYGQSVDLTMNEYTMRLYALLPYRVEAMGLTPEAAKPSPGKDGRIAVEIKASGAAAQGMHWLRVDVFRPDGAPADAYGGNVPASGGKATLVIPFALNDPHGVWKVAVRDVATGVRSTCSMTLE